MYIDNLRKSSTNTCALIPLGSLKIETTPHFLALVCLRRLVILVIHMYGSFQGLYTGWLPRLLLPDSS